MKRTIRTALVAAFFCLGTVARADEGMWMVHALTKAIEADMQARGCKLSANEIYNSDAEGSTICDAIVSLDFECTGSVISDKGLVITNHHCAYSDVFKLSTDEHNYLEDGYWALYQNEEIPIPGKKMLFLRKVLDVTEEVNKLAVEQQLLGKPFGMRRLSYIMEKRYGQEGLQTSLESMWGGSKYYLCFYEIYSDIRLVAAPPVSIAAFGGDIDNWDWPQHKCDFAMYRIYTGPDGKPAKYSEDNVPLKPRRSLEISLDGYKPGDYAMVLGYPGITHRYNSSYKVAFEQDVTLPISNDIRGKYMEILKKWMNADPSVRLKYSDRFFSLSNVQELQEGTVACYKRFNVVREKQQIEKELLSDRRELLDSLGDIYAKLERLKRNETYFKECIVRGTFLFVAAARLSAVHAKSPLSIDDVYEGIDLRVEKDLFRLAIEEFFEHVDDEYLGSFHKSLKAQYGKDYDAMCEALWVEDRMMTKEDGLCRFLSEVKINQFHICEDAISKGGASPLIRQYVRALYKAREERGIAQYPDANSTLRLSYGTVGELSPRDAVVNSWKSTKRGILEKYNPDQYEYKLKADWKDLLENNEFCKKYKWSGEVDFITDNDITGGNSGSPVLDAQGRLIGLAFDGNTESLAGDSSFTRDYNKCINVDIRYVLFCLDKFGKMDRIVSELGF